MNSSDHPIFLESIRRIQKQLGEEGCNALQNQVIYRVIHTSGDFHLKSFLHFTKDSCEIGLAALLAGAPILTDTQMSAVAVRPMAMRTVGSPVHSALDWAPKNVPIGMTRTAIGMTLAWKELSQKFYEKQLPIVLIGSSPTALNALLDLISAGAPSPSLIIGMPVGFVGVEASKSRLQNSGLVHIRLDGTRGGASISAAVVNALLRASQL